MEKKLKDVKRIVVKIGTSTLIKDNTSMDVERIENIVNQMAHLIKDGYEVIFVSSGAVGTGNCKLGINANTTASQKQASAAVGQVLLMNLYRELFEKHDINVGQILLTKDDVTNRKRNLNVKNTINELLKMGVIPIINENDSTVVYETKVGDNDNLSALIAILAEASLLILLSDIDGIYTDNPTKNKDAVLLDTIEQVDEEIMSYAKDKGSKFATGGMLTKLEAAKKITIAGAHMIIANGSRDNILVDIIENNFIGSLFIADESKLAAKKKWLLLSSYEKGYIMVDDGATKVIKDGHSSLLAVGIVAIKGIFDFGDVVSIVDKDSNVIARGITNYSSLDINEIKGLKNSEFDHLYDTVVHIDNLVLIKGGF